MKKKFLSVIICVFMAVGLLTPIAHATDYSASRIVSYVNGRVGESYANGYCLRFVDECFDYIYGYREYSACAYESGNAYIDSTSRDNIPLGSCIFFGGSSVVCSHCGNNAGHIGIYVGDGNIVHAWAGTIVCTSIDYVVGRGYPYRGYGWLCDVVLTTDPIPPSSAQISIDKESVRCGENFTITCSSDTSSQYYLAIFDADSGEKIIAENVANGIFKNSFQKAGKYNAYMTAYNSEGSVNSNWITFYVFGDPPTKAALSVNKTEMVANDTVTFKSSSDAYYVKIYISIFCNEILAYSGGIPYDLNYKPTSDGIYTAHITAYTHEGGVDSNWVTFYVGKYNVSYNANGGSGAPSAQTKIYGKNLTISNFVPTREGYTFTGWNTKPNGTGTSYLSSGIYNLNSNATLYAQWSQNSINPTTSTTATRTGSRIEIQTSISNLSQSASCVAAVYDSSGKLLGQTANDVDGSTNSVTAYFTNYSNAAYIKVFLWDSLKGMKPLTNGEKVTL